MLTSNDLERFIAAEMIAATLVWPGVPTPTVLDAAAALRVAPAQIIKSVLFMADGEPVLVVASGLAKISSKLLADYLGLARRRVRVALGEKVTAVTGYIPGSVPPFGHMQPLTTVLEDEVLTLMGDIYGGGGDLDALLRLSLAELRRVVGEKTAVLVE
ncbi:MAG: hypothetical protein KC423_13495 [Anaerolineales bacterium]|nr:hypothetical protein [Anaerolineales bacterium]